MKRVCWLILVISLSLTACATISEHYRMDRFEEVAGAFRRAMLASDFNAAIQFIDPRVKSTDVDLGSYKLLRIVDYQTSDVAVSEQHRKIEQDVDLQYYRINIRRLRSLRYHQVWSYDEAHKSWLLQTNLPDFDR